MPFSKQFSVHLAELFAIKTPIAPPIDYFLALHTAAPTASATNAEVSDAAYKRMPLTLQSILGSEGQDLINTEVIVFPPGSVDNGEVGFFSIWTEGIAGEPHFYGELDAPIIYNIGISPSLAIGSLKLTMAMVPCAPIP